jgi:hypothetical protein
MKIVSDETYKKTILETKNILKKIFQQSSPIKHQSSKIIIINTMPTFSFKLLITFCVLGEYLRKEGYIVKYLFEDSCINHCDMVNMQDNISIKFLCNRCMQATKQFKELSDDFLYFSDFLEGKIEQKKYKEAKLSKLRYCGNLDFPQYEKDANDNLYKSELIASNLYKTFKPSVYISLTHNSVYSNSSMYKYFEQNKVKCINIGRGTYKRNGIAFFTKSTDNSIKNEIIHNLDFNNKKRDTIKKFLNNRTQIKQLNSEEKNLIKKINDIKKSGKKVVAIFPNVMDDATCADYHSVFSSAYEWIEKTIDFLLTNNFFVIVRAHPAEVTWNMQEGIITYLQKKIANNNILYINANEKLRSYSFLNYIDIASVYTGTLLIECMYKRIPVVAGGNSYIIEQIFDKTTSQKEYFDSFFKEKDLIYNDDKYNNLLKMAYIDFFCRDIKVDFLDTTLNYPNIDLDKILNLPYNYKPFKLIKSIIEDTFNIEENIDILEIN